MTTQLQAHEALEELDDAFDTYQAQPSTWKVSKNGKPYILSLSWTCFLDHRYGYTVGYGSTKREAKAEAIEQLRMLAEGIEIPFKLNG